LGDVIIFQLKTFQFCYETQHILRQNGCRCIFQQISNLIAEYLAFLSHSFCDEAGRGVELWNPSLLGASIQAPSNIKAGSWLDLLQKNAEGTEEYRMSPSVSQ